MLIKKQVFALSLQNDKQSKFSPSTLQINQTQCPKPCESLAKTPGEGYYSPLQWSYRPKDAECPARVSQKVRENSSNDFLETLHNHKGPLVVRTDRAGFFEKTSVHP